MTKKDANYKIIKGMNALGNQCRDCTFVVRDTIGTMGCKILNATVSCRAHCDKFERAAK